ncbi:hypothetical protein MRX96_041972 [Rhipicephalus microplus]
MGSSVMRASLIRNTTAVFSLVVTATVSEAWWWEKINATCPRLDHCVCENGTYAVFIKCRHIADAHQLDGDMAKLLGIPHKKLTFESVNITDLPLEWFLNKKVNILYIFQCPLRNMSASVIENIQGLRKLRMKKGKLESVPPGLAAARHLSILRVSENPIKVLRGALSMPNLIELDLSHNAIENVDEDYLSAFPNLIRLNLSRNNISHLAPNILDKIKKVKDLKILSLTGNFLKYIEDGAFSDNLGLAHISVTENKIQWIGRNAFKGLVSLRSLRLDRNQLHSLNGSIKNLPKLKYVEASGNSIRFLQTDEFENDSGLKYVYLSRNNISNTQGAFTAVAALMTLDLGHNRLETMRRSDFPHRMKQKLILIIRDNPLMCDCRLSWLMQRESAVRMLGNAVCSSPSWHKGKELFTIAEHDFARWDDDCSAGCHCECHEGPLGSRDIHVNCTSRRLTSIPTVLPQGTMLLDLQDNEISTLDDTLKTAAPELQFLSLKDNVLQNLNVTFIPVKLQNIDLRGNNFKRMPYSLLTERNLTAIWLSGNRFACDCADYPLMRWIQVHVDVIKDIHDVVCADGSNPLIARKSFVSLGEKDLCPEMVSGATTYTYLLMVLGLVAVTLTLLSIYLRWKHNIRTWLDARGWGCLTRSPSDGELDDDMLFDVFISFSSKDQDFVHDNILPIMDTHGFAYCTYERNFKGGFLLQDIIHDAVAMSRRTLLVLTQDFVESEWCRWEFRVAHRRALQDKVNRLIVVLVDECASGSLDEDLRATPRGRPLSRGRQVGTVAGDNEGAQPL